MAAKPKLLLFLDEPTSGLDSQTWSICNLMEKLAKHGQAILVTIHQPSAVLFQRFDRVLFLGKGGKTVYFGEIGEGSSILTSYFERNGAPKCSADANPAEWMLEIIGSAPGSHTDIDWPQVWRRSPEIAEIHAHHDELKDALPILRPMRTGQSIQERADYQEFTAPFSVQVWECLKRVFSQYWRTPSYIYSKCLLCTSTVSRTWLRNVKEYRHYNSLFALSKVAQSHICYIKSNLSLIAHKKLPVLYMVFASL